MLSAVLIFGMLMQPKVPHHTPTPVHHSTSAPRHVTTPAPSSKPVEQAPSPVQAHHVSNSVVTPATPTSYTCTFVDDLSGRTTLVQSTPPDYYEGTAYCDSSSVAVVQRAESIHERDTDAPSQNSAHPGEVYCTYVRMLAETCTNGGYLSVSESAYDQAIAANGNADSLNGWYPISETHQ